MQPLLFDEGLPGGQKVSNALQTLGLEANIVGAPAAPPTGSSDEVNCKWCAANSALLVTHDKGKKEREILGLLDTHQVGAIIVLPDLRRQPPHHLVRALLHAESQMDDLVAKGRRIRHRLRASGTLKKPGK